MNTQQNAEAARTLLEQGVEKAQMFLEQMSEYPNETLSVLDEAEQVTLMKQLDVLVEQAAAIQCGTDLLSLVDAIHRLVEDRAGLKALLLPEETEVTNELLLLEETDLAEERAQRAVTLADQQATMEFNAYVQQRAPQIHNTLITCRTHLEAALQKKVESEPRPPQGKSHDNAKH